MSQKLLTKLKEEQDKEFSYLNSEELVAQSEVFLLEAHDEDLKTLENIGIDHTVKYDNKRKDDYKRTKHAEKLYGAESYTGKQIKALCNTYYLKMLPAFNYKGDIPTDLPRVVNEFCKKNSLDIKKECFFILAPVSEFKNEVYTPPKPVKRPVMVDPILFYRQPDEGTNRVRPAEENDVFSQVINWGNDFSEWRKVLHWFSRYYSGKDNETSMLASTVIASLFYMIAIISAFVTSTMLIPTCFALLGFIITLSNSFGEKNIDKLWNEAVV